METKNYFNEQIKKLNDKFGLKLVDIHDGVWDLTLLGDTESLKNIFINLSIDCDEEFKMGDCSILFICSNRSLIDYRFEQLMSEADVRGSIEAIIETLNLLYSKKLYAKKLPFLIFLERYRVLTSDKQSTLFQINEPLERNEIILIENETPS